MIGKHLSLIGQAEVPLIGKTVDVLLECVGKFAINVIPAIAPNFHIHCEEYV